MNQMPLNSRSGSPSGRHLLDRRDFLGNSATALGSIALTSLLSQDRLLAKSGPAIDPANPYAPRSPHFVPKAKNVIVIFCAGAVSQLETWDYKPELIKFDGKPFGRGSCGDVSGPGGRACQASVSISATRSDGQNGVGHDSPPCRSYRRFCLCSLAHQ